MKVLVSADDRILGFTMIGSEAGEVMAAVETAMLAGLPYQPLRDAVVAHLTMTAPGERAAAVGRSAPEPGCAHRGAL